jgi:hypothetical protein
MEINLKLTLSFLLPAVFMLLLAGCGDSQTADTPTPEAQVVAKVEVEPSPTSEPPKPEPTKSPAPTEVPPTPTATPTPIPTPTQVPPTATLTPSPTATFTPVPTPTPTAEFEELYSPDETESAVAKPPQETQIPDQQIDRAEKQESFFWNERQPGFPDCTTDFKFSHQFANPEDVAVLFFGPGGHIEPHEHMLYWESGPVEGIETLPGKKRQESRKIQLYAPTDIYRVNLGYANRTTNDGDKYIEWGGYLYTCNGHQLMLGHIGEPSDDMLAALAEAEPTCGLVSSYNPEPGCTWRLDTFIPSGTPIFKNSGYTGAFDFGLSLSGLTSKELQEQPGYGYSITPWRVSSGRAVCPLEYFPEPLRSEYLQRLRHPATGELFECGPFNQDVPGTAMGFWLPSPSPETPPMDPSEAFEDEWETIWLFQSNNDPSIHILSVGNNTFGLDYGQYQISTVSEGLVNRRWDAIKPGDVYCAEFTEAQNEESELTIEKTLILRLSEDGTALTVEAINIDKCGGSPWEFQGGERTFYR